MRTLVILLIGALTSIQVSADTSEPFTTLNANPFVQIHGLPLARSAHLVPDGKLSWQLQTEIVNNWAKDLDPTESIFIDGETYKATLSLRYGLNDNWEVGIDVPYVRHEPGHLDSAIEDFHDLFGFSDGNREDAPRDQLNYSYNSGGTTVALRKSATGIGDVRLNLGYKFLERENQLWSIRAGVKLATGDADDLTGSEGTDVSLGVHLAQASIFGKESLFFHGSFGVVALGDGEIIEDSVEDWAAYASSTLSWQFSRRFSLKAQFDFHSAFYDSDFDEIGDVAGQITFGGSINLGKNTQLDLSISEDIFLDTAPDVVFGIGVRSRF